jgi:Na+/phosphate symporter
MSLSERDGSDVLVLLGIANNLEYIGDRIAIDIATSTAKRIRDGVRADPKRVARLTRIHAGVTEALEDAIRSAVRDDPDLAADVLARKVGLNRLRHQIETMNAAALSASGDTLAAYVREIEMVEILDSIFRGARTIAEAVLRDDEDEDEGAGQAA